MDVAIIQQGAWDSERESMPLAAGYLKAVIDQPQGSESRTSVRIVNARGGELPADILRRILKGGLPDVVGFSVLGWNIKAFESISETLKQIKPDMMIVFGGNHVANQGQEILKRREAVDVVVNSEGEFTFAELVRMRETGAPLDELGQIPGLTFRNSDGLLVDTGERDRIEDLAMIPSPVLSGSIELLGDDGKFKYDVALMETSRGCPYRCSFCYWGGAVGQRMREFPSERLRDELDLYASLQVETIVLCDSNFGMTQHDEDFIDNVIAVRESTGYPHAVETSWAKNKSARFRRIVEKMHNAGLKSSFTLALQSLDDNTLQIMGRRNMKVNQWQPMVEWLVQLGMDCYAELIWGSPGESVESFLRGYDALAEFVPRIATYPLLVMPNTDFFAKRQEYGLVLIKGVRDDFEYVVSHRDVTWQENLFMLKFLFWSRVLAEHPVLRGFWPACRVLLRMSQSTVIRSIITWIEETADERAAPLRGLSNSVGDPDAITAALRYIYSAERPLAFLCQWFRTVKHDAVDNDAHPLVANVLRHDLLTLPELLPASSETQRTEDFEFDVISFLDELRIKRVLSQAPGAYKRRTVLTADVPGGLGPYVDNHEQSHRFVATISA